MRRRVPQALASHVDGSRSGTCLRSVASLAFSGGCVGLLGGEVLPQRRSAQTRQRLSRAVCFFYSVAQYGR